IVFSENKHIFLLQPFLFPRLFYSMKGLSDRKGAPAPLDEPLLEDLSHDLAQHFHRLVLAYQNWIYAFAWRQTGIRDEAEDIMQEVFLQVYVTLDTYPAQRIRELKLRPWLAK